jgi:cytochrome P450
MRNRAPCVRRATGSTVSISPSSTISRRVSRITTRDAISGGLAALVDHTDQLVALRKDASLMSGASEEVLRWTTPSPSKRRTATVDAELGGHRIAAGEKVGASPARLEIRVVYEEVLSRSRSIEAAGPIEWTRSNRHTGIRHHPLVLRR